MLVTLLNCKKHKETYIKYFGWKTIGVCISTYTCITTLTIVLKSVAPIGWVKTK